MAAEAAAAPALVAVEEPQQPLVVGYWGIRGLGAPLRMVSTPPASAVQHLRAQQQLACWRELHGCAALMATAMASAERRLCSSCGANSVCACWEAHVRSAVSAKPPAGNRVCVVHVLRSSVSTPAHAGRPGCTTVLPATGRP